MKDWIVAWHEEEDYCVAERVLVEKGYADYIAKYVHGEENAHLVSAAPDMLEALKNIENDDGNIPSKIWDMIGLAIAKAEGRE